MYASRSVSFCYPVPPVRCARPDAQDYRSTRVVPAEVRKQRTPQRSSYGQHQGDNPNPQFVSLSLERAIERASFSLYGRSRLLSFYSLALTSCAYSTTYVTQCGGNRHICPPDVCSDGASLHVGDLVGLLPARLYPVLCMRTVIEAISGMEGKQS